jgi:hypothetical protein
MNCYFDLQSDIVWARPDQSLRRHLSNMIDQIPKILDNSMVNYPVSGLFDGLNTGEIKATHDKLLKFDRGFLQGFVSIIFACHDFGKLNSQFQQKICHVMDKNSPKQVPKLANSCRAFSYHAQIGSLLCWLMLFEYTKHIYIDNRTIRLNFSDLNEDLELFNQINPDNSSENTLIPDGIENIILSYLTNYEILDDFRDEVEYFGERVDLATNSISQMQIKNFNNLDQLLIVETRVVLGAIGTLSVLMHHNRGLDNSIENMENSIHGVEINDVLTTIINDIKKTYLISKNADQEFHGGIHATYNSLLENDWWNPLFCKSLTLLFQLVESDLDELFEIYNDYNHQYFRSFSSSYLKLAKAMNLAYYNHSGAYSLLYAFFYSTLCEADEWDAKSYILDTMAHKLDFEQQRISINQDLISNYRSAAFNKIAMEDSFKKLLNDLRNALYTSVAEGIKNLNPSESKIFFIDAPTGSGKTLALLNAGLLLKKSYKEMYGLDSRIIYSLPFITIIEQVAEVVRSILNQTGMIDKLPADVQTQIMTIHHHLMDSKWLPIEVEDDEEILKIDEGTISAHHQVNTWQSEIIVTSFVKLFNTLCKAHKREYIRFHRLASSIILIDEIQGIPVEYWDLIGLVLTHFCNVFNSTVILASATSPKQFIQNKGVICKDLFLIPDTIRKGLNRYTVNLRFLSLNNSNSEPSTLNLSEFAKIILQEWHEGKFSNILVVVNTTRVAYSLFDFLAKNIEGDSCLLTFHPNITSAPLVRN